MTLLRTVLSFCMLALTGASAAQSGASCDASVQVGSCRATVSAEGNRVVIKTDVKGCSRVEWQVDGVNHTTTVLDGFEAIENIMGPPKELQALSCVEVKDLRTRAASPPADQPEETVFSAKCTYEGSSVPIESVQVKGRFRSAQAQRNAAEQACAPIIARANRTCAQPAIIQSRIAQMAGDPSQASRMRELEAELRAAEAVLPAYCR